MLKQENSIKIVVHTVDSVTEGLSFFIEYFNGRVMTWLEKTDAYYDILKKACVYVQKAAWDNYYCTNSRCLEATIFLPEESAKDVINLIDIIRRSGLCTVSETETLRIEVCSEKIGLAFFTKDSFDSFSLQKRAIGPWTISAHMWTTTFGGCCDSYSELNVSRKGKIVAHRLGKFRDGENEKRDDSNYYIDGITIIEADDTELFYAILVKNSKGIRYYKATSINS